MVEQSKALSKRITPACAGNSARAELNALYFLDHPRLRGEQYAAKKGESMTEGSPPLARGTVQWRHVDFKNGGITPACAGNSL